MTKNKMHGVVEAISTVKASGWLMWESEYLDAEGNLLRPLVGAFYKNNQIGLAIPDIDRSDLHKLKTNAFGFELHFDIKLDSDAQLVDVKFYAKYQDEITYLNFYKPLAASLAFLALDETHKKYFINRVSNSLDALISDLKLNGYHNLRNKLEKKKKLAVVTYANDSKAWFPYFFQYYANLFGSESLYIFTPSPELFSNYNLGGLISLSGFVFDDYSRAYLMSQFCTGLQAYYEWTLVCDVDEIVLPHPKSGKQFLETLDSEDVAVFVSRGVDVIQDEGEVAFDFKRTVLEQRSVGIPNLALYKPHISKVPINYAAGFHYCNHKSILSNDFEGFVTLHLKWACKKIREEVSEVVSEIKYSDKKTAEYSVRTSSNEAMSNLVKTTKTFRLCDWDSKSLRELEESFINGLTYSAATGIWGGKLNLANFKIILTS